MKVHQAFLRRKTDCQSIGRINIKPSSKGYANDSDVFCTFGKAMKRRRVSVCQARRYIWGQWGFVPHPHLLLTEAEELTRYYTLSPFGTLLFSMIQKNLCRIWSGLRFDPNLQIDLFY